MTDPDLLVASQDPAAFTDARFGIYQVCNPHTGQVLVYARATKSDERAWRDLRRLHPELVKPWELFKKFFFEFF